MNEITIQIYDRSYLEAILALHRLTFLPLYEEAQYEVNRKGFEKDLTAGQAYIARNDKEVIGFGSYQKIGDEPIVKESLENYLAWAENKANESELLVYQKKKAKEIGKGEAFVEIYENPITQGNLKVMDNDMYLSEMAVHIDFRRQGIGSELARRRIQEAKKQGSTAIYVHCWEGGPSANLYAGLGFLPVIRRSPVYKDGSGQTVMVLILENQ